MKIKKLVNCDGAEKFGTCVECGKGSKEDPDMVKIVWDGNSSTILCKECMLNLKRNISRIPFSPKNQFGNLQREKDIYNLRKEGKTFKEIGDTVGISHEMAHKIYKKIEKNGLQKNESDPIYGLTTKMRNLLRKRFGIESLYDIPRHRFTGDRWEFDDFGDAFIISANNLCKKYDIDCSNMTKAFIKSKRLKESEIEYIINQI